MGRAGHAAPEDADGALVDETTRELPGPPPAAGASEPEPAVAPVLVAAPGRWPSDRPIVVGEPTPELEPTEVSAEHRTVPYRPDTVLDGWSTGTFTVRGASLRGHIHRYDGAPRQDDMAILHRRASGHLVVVVADGVSAAKQSHMGATVAARYASQWLDASLAEPVGDTDWRAMVESAAWALIQQAAALEGDAEQVDAEVAERILATTLACAVVEPPHDDATTTVHVVTVGDSGVWVLDDGGYTPVGGGKTASEDGLASSAVSGLPRVPNEVVAATVALAPGQVLLVGSDGFGDPLGDGGGEVGRLFAETLLGRVPSIVEMGHVLDFSRETFDDDRTLVAVWLRETG